MSYVQKFNNMLNKSLEKTPDCKIMLENKKTCPIKNQLQANKMP